MMVVIGRACLIVIIEDSRRTRDLLPNIVTVSSFGRNKKGFFTTTNNCFELSLVPRNELC